LVTTTRRIFLSAEIYQKNSRGDEFQFLIASYAPAAAATNRLKPRELSKQYRSVSNPVGQFF